MDDLDIWRSAGTLVKMYGVDEAVRTASLRADALRNQGDAEGHFVWKRIAWAIGELRRNKPLQGEALS